MPEENRNSANDPNPMAEKPQPSPAGDVPTRTVKEPRGQSNPFYGCAILIIAVATFGFIITWTVYSGLKQNAEINSFTTTDAPALPPLAVGDAAKSAMQTKLNAFATMAELKKPVTLTLTPEELNTIVVIAGETGVADYRDMVRFSGFDAASQSIKADIRWKMNNLPFVKGPDRYLSGHATFKPVIENNALELHIQTLDVPGKTVSPGFLRQLSNWPWLNLAKLKEEVKNPLSKVTRFEFSADNSLFILQCGEPVKS